MVYNCSDDRIGLHHKMRTTLDTIKINDSEAEGRSATEIKGYIGLSSLDASYVMGENGLQLCKLSIGARSLRAILPRISIQIDFCKKHHEYTLTWRNRTAGQPMNQGYDLGKETLLAGLW